MFGTTKTPEEKAAKEQRKAERRAEAARAAVAREEARKQRFEAMPHFVVRETREITVKAADMQDAIALAAVAFKEGQQEDYSLSTWDRPSHIEGDTIDQIRVVNVKAVESDL